MNAVIYARYSSDNQRAESIEGQLRECTAYPEAVTLLLNGEQGEVYPAAKQKEEQPPKSFELPPANSDARRVYAYLLKQRHIDREIISHPERLNR